VEMYDHEELGDKIITLDHEIKNAQDVIARYQHKDKAENRSQDPADPEKTYQDALATLHSKQDQLEALQKSVGADHDPQRAGYFHLDAPAFTNEQALRLNRPEWTVLNSGFDEEFKGQRVKPSDKLLWLGAKGGPWEIELKIPQKHVGHVLKAFHGDHNKELDVEFLLRTDPSRKYIGKLRLDKMANEALSNKEDKDEAEPSVLAYVRIDNEGIDDPHRKIDAAYLLPREMLLPSAEVHAKVCCDDHPMGYSLFYGVFEFLYEKVVFFF